MPSLLTLPGIDQAIAALALKPDTLKARLLEAIRRRLPDEESLGNLAAIDPEELAREIYQVSEPAAIKAKRKSLSSLKSALNKSLRELNEEQNPEAVIIGRDNVFMVSEERKDDLLRELAVGGGASPASLRELFNSFKQLFAKVVKEQGVEEIRDIIEEIDASLLAAGIARLAPTDASQGATTAAEETPTATAEQAESIAEPPTPPTELGPGTGDEEIIELPEGEEEEEFEVIEETAEGEEVEIIEEEAEGEEIEVVEEIDEAELAEIAAGEGRRGQDEGTGGGEESAIGASGDLGGAEEIERIDADETEALSEAEEIVEIAQTGAAENTGAGGDEPGTGESDALPEGEIELIEEATAEEEEFEVVEELDEANLTEGAAGEGSEEGEADGGEGSAAGATGALNEAEEIEEIDADVVEEPAEEGEIVEVDAEEIEELAEEEETAEIAEIAETEELEEVDAEEIEEFSATEEIAKVAAGGEAAGTSPGPESKEAAGPLEILSRYMEAEEALADPRDYLKETDEEYASHILNRFMPRFVRIPGGDYLVGSSHPRGPEMPRRTVNLPPFYLGQFPVTNDLFDLFVRETGYQTEAELAGYGVVVEGRCTSEVDPATGRATVTLTAGATSRQVSGACWRHPRGPASSLEGKYHHPVVQVSCNDAMAFAAWAGKRLPREDEWEAAARGAADGRLFPWGDTWLEERGNFESSLRGDTAPVEQTGRPAAASPFGIHDLLGNIYEWTATLHQAAIQADQRRAAGTAARRHAIHVLKGGCWTSRGVITISHRIFERANTWSNIIGFRCAV